MKKGFLIVIGVLSILTSCIPEDVELKDLSLTDENKRYNPIHKSKDLINKEGTTLESRIGVPKGFTRIEVEEGSFYQYLREIPLKPHGARVQYYNGGFKQNTVYEAVVDMDVGDRDLQQCADAIIRLRAEYLYREQRYDEIHFNFTNGFKVDYKSWMEGKRIVVEGNNTHWEQRTTASNTYEDFRKYLNIVFAYAGTLSLSKELESIEPDDLMIGDVIIEGGSPGHGVIVVDMAKDESSGGKIFLLAQSYMPAQSIHILKNPTNEKLSPWYDLNFGEKLYTPEWTFERKDFKRFP